MCHVFDLKYTTWFVDKRAQIPQAPKKHVSLHDMWRKANPRAPGSFLFPSTCLFLSPLCFLPSYLRSFMRFIFNFSVSYSHRLAEFSRRLWGCERRWKVMDAPHKTLLGRKTHPLILLVGGKGGGTPKNLCKKCDGLSRGGRVEFSIFLGEMLSY